MLSLGDGLINLPLLEVGHKEEKLFINDIECSLCEVKLEVFSGLVIKEDIFPLYRY